MSTNRDITNAVRKALREGGALKPVDRVTTHDDLVRVDGRQVPAHVTRVMLEPTLGDLSADRIATVLRNAGFKVYALVWDGTVPHVEVHTIRTDSDTAPEVAEPVTATGAARLYVPNGPTVLVLGSDTVHGQAGVWVRRDDAPDAPEYFASEDFLKTGFWAYPDARAPKVETMTRPRDTTPCRCPDDKHQCTSENCRNNPPFPGEKSAADEARNLRVAHYAAKLAQPDHAPKLAALRTVVTIGDEFRSGIVSVRGSRARGIGFTVPTARALVRWGLLSEHALPHKGFRVTDLGRDVAGYADRTAPPATSAHTPKRKPRRCEAPSTKNATSAEHYTTCPGWLDESGDCPEAGSHVEL